MTKFLTGKTKTMSTAYISTAKGMADFLLSREHRGPGDTIEAASFRIQNRFGVPATFLMRLRHREVKDVLMSNFMALAHAYRTATERMNKAYEHERTLSVDPNILRLADLISGKEASNTTEEA